MVQASSSLGTVLLCFKAWLARGRGIIQCLSIETQLEPVRKEDLKTEPPAVPGQKPSQSRILVSTVGSPQASSEANGPPRVSLSQEISIRRHFILDTRNSTTLSSLGATGSCIHY